MSLSASLSAASQHLIERIRSGEDVSLIDRLHLATQLAAWAVEAHHLESLPAARLRLAASNGHAVVADHLG